jgi:teichuronic acid biosynthesis glycosyltransferase TuaC
VTPVTRPVRTLLFSTLYPSSARPIHGIFVETRLRELLGVGGVETRVVAPVPWFPSANPRWGEYARYARTPLRETRNGIAVLHPRYPLLPKIGMTTAPLLLALASIPALRRVRREGFDFDVIDAHYYYPDGVAAALLARWFRRPVTITARGTDLNLIPDHALPRRMIRWAAGQADASIGVCSALMDVLRGWGIDAQRLHVMRNGVDLERFRPLPPATSRVELGIEGAPVLLSVGHLIERKGHHADGASAAPAGPVADRRGRRRARAPGGARARARRGLASDTRRSRAERSVGALVQRSRRTDPRLQPRRLGQRAARGHGLRDTGGRHSHLGHARSGGRRSSRAAGRPA